jgi:hypothetical protein
VAPRKIVTYTVTGNDSKAMFKLAVTRTLSVNEVGVIAASIPTDAHVFVTPTASLAEVLLLRYFGTTTTATWHGWFSKLISLGPSS